MEMYLRLVVTVGLFLFSGIVGVAARANACEGDDNVTAQVMHVCEDGEFNSGARNVYLDTSRTLKGVHDCLCYIKTNSPAIWILLRSHSLIYNRSSDDTGFYIGDKYIKSYTIEANTGGFEIQIPIKYKRTGSDLPESLCLSMFAPDFVRYSVSCIGNHDGIINTGGVMPLSTEKTVIVQGATADSYLTNQTSSYLNQTTQTSNDKAVYKGIHIPITSKQSHRKTLSKDGAVGIEHVTTTVPARSIQHSIPETTIGNLSIHQKDVDGHEQAVSSTDILWIGLAVVGAIGVVSLCAFAFALAFTKKKSARNMSLFCGRGEARESRIYSEIGYLHRQNAQACAINNSYERLQLSGLCTDPKSKPDSQSYPMTLLANTDSGTLSKHQSYMTPV